MKKSNKDSLAILIPEHSEASRIMYEPQRGDLRMCGHDQCDYMVLFLDHEWAHLPKGNVYPGNVGHEPFPYPEHKHRFKILGTDGVVYFYKCDLCGYVSDTSRKLIRYLLSGKWDKS